MNRAERRRLERESGKVQKEKVYTLTQSQIDAMKKKAVDDAVSIGFTLMLSIPVTILHDNIGLKRQVRNCLSLWISA